MTNQSLVEAGCLAIARHEAKALALLSELVEQNSYTAHHEGVDAVGQRLAEALNSAGLRATAKRDEVCAAHWLFETQAAADQKAFLLMGHHDTVFPPGTFEGFSIQGDLAHGPGVLDMKGGLTVVVLTLWALDAIGVLGDLPLCFVSVADEETGSVSSGPWLSQLARRAKGALVFEAGRPGDAILTSRRGSGRATVRALGRAAHAGNAIEDGRSAIRGLSQWIDRVEALTSSERGISVNVGTIHGGTSRNTVPAQATAEVDLRFCDRLGQHFLLSSLERCAREVEALRDGVELTVTSEISREPWEQTPQNLALAAAYGRCQLASGLEERLAPRAGGGSDANTLASCGLPVIDGLGPRGTGFHTPEERIWLSSLSRKSEALLRFLLSSHPR